MLALEHISLDQLPKLWNDIGINHNYFMLTGALRRDRLINLHMLQNHGAHSDQSHHLPCRQTQHPRKLSYETQLIEFIDNITKNLDKGKHIDCLIMDFSKAFDKISQSPDSQAETLRHNRQDKQLDKELPS